MSARRPIAALAAAALLVLGLVPAVLAVGPDVSGTLALPDGSPAVGYDVTVLVAGSDMAWTATTDDQGAWSATTGVQAGQQLSVRVVRVAYSSPDRSGCVIGSGLVASADLAVDALPVPPIALVLAPGPQSKVCSATATPRHAPTPPATDAGAPTSPGRSGVPLVIGALLGVALVAIGPARRPKRR